MSGHSRRRSSRRETAAFRPVRNGKPHDADIVLDLHGDDQAVVHVYVGESLWPAARDLATWMGAEVTLRADDSGVTPFDEAGSSIGRRLAERFLGHPVPPAGLSATVALRDLDDLSHERAARPSKPRVKIF